MKNLAPSVSIITVNYNGKKYLKPLFDSLFSLSYPHNKLEIFMVDNNSNDNSIQFVRKHFRKVKIIENDINNYCKANNLGIKASRGEYIALINNDLTVDKNWLKELVKVIEQNKKIGAVTGKILFPNGKLQSTGHCEFPNFYWCDRGLKDEDRGQFNKIESILGLSHTAVLYRKSCLDQIGLLDEDFHMYLEDVDISLRAKQKGWQLFYAPESIAYHKFHGSIDEDEVIFYCEKNRLLLIAKHYPEKLNDALYGRGYFNVAQDEQTDQSHRFKSVIPELINKLIKHHDLKRIQPILNDLLNGFKKMVDLDKHRLTQRLDYEKGRRANQEEIVRSLNSDLNLQKQNIERLHDRIEEFQSQLNNLNDQLQTKQKDLIRRQNEIEALHTTYKDEIQDKDREIQDKDREIQDKDREIQDHCLKLKERIKEIESLNNKINEKDQQIQNTLQEKNALLMQKENSIAYLNRMICLTRDELLAIYASRGYFIADLLRNWKPNSLESTFRREKDFKILLVKPQRVSLESTKKIISEIKQQRPDAWIALMANLVEEDYMALSGDPRINLPLLYCPMIRKLTYLELVRLLFKLRRLKLDLALALFDKPYYSGFRRSKLLVALSGAKRREEHFVHSELRIQTNARKDRRSIKNPIKDALLFLLNEFMLLLTILGFLIFIVPSIKFLKIKYRLKSLFPKKAK